MVTSMTSDEAQQKINAEILGQIGKKPRQTKWTKIGWVFMRISGVLLVILVTGHLYSNLMAANAGIHNLDFEFVANKFANPFWRWWDVALLWFALIHGSNGMRTLVSDYVVRPGLRKGLSTAIIVAAVFLLLVGTYVIATFDPCSGILGDGSAWDVCRQMRG